MNKQEFVKILEKIEIAYKKKFKQEEYREWFREFKTTNKEEFERAVNKAIKELIFTPKIADVRARIAINPNDYYTKDPYAHLYKNLEWCELVKESE